MNASYILDALKREVQKRGPKQLAQIAREIKIHRTSLSKIMHAHQAWVEPDTAEKIERWLAARNALPDVSATALPPRFREVTIFGISQACSMANPPCDMMPQIHDSELQTVVVHNHSNHRFAAFRVEGQSMEPTLRDGWTVICDCDSEPVNGDIVVAKFKDTAVIKRFHRVGVTALLTSVAKGGKEYEVHCNDLLPENGGWILKVVQFNGVPN